MEIEIEWRTPVLIAQHRKIVFDEERGYDRFEDGAGVYFFSRKHSDSFKPFYIGRSSSIPKRLKQHMGTRKICDVLRGINDLNMPEIGHGARYFHAGYLRNKRGAQQDRCLQIVERFLIRYALEEKLPLVNQALTKMSSNILTFAGPPRNRGIFPTSAEIPAD